MTSIISLIYTNAQQAPLQLYLQIYIYSIYNVAEGQLEFLFYVIRFAQLVLPSILGYFLLLRFTITIEAILNATLSFISHRSLKWASNKFQTSSWRLLIIKEGDLVCGWASSWPFRLGCPQINGQQLPSSVNTRCMSHRVLIPKKYPTLFCVVRWTNAKQLHT